jgi:hypothetical protein
MRNRCQFSLRLLCLVFCGVCGVAAGLGWLRAEVVGRIETTEGPSSGTSPTIAFSCLREADAAEMRRNFDRDSFLADVNRFVRQSIPGSSQSVNVNVYVVEVPNHFVIKLDYERWGRRRLSLWQFQYYFDFDDPVAHERNVKILSAFKLAASRLAQQHPMCELLLTPDDHSEL